MTTTGNREWAFTEAKRRSPAMNGAYSIYQHVRNTDDYIIRSAYAAPPIPRDWRLIATFEPDGAQSFAISARI